MKEVWEDQICIKIFILKWMNWNRKKGMLCDYFMKLVSWHQGSHYEDRCTETCMYSCHWYPRHRKTYKAWLVSWAALNNQLIELYHWNGNVVIVIKKFFTNCTGSCQSDNFQCSQWQFFFQNNNIIITFITKHMLRFTGAIYSHWCHNL